VAGRPSYRHPGGYGSARHEWRQGHARHPARARSSPRDSSSTWARDYMRARSGYERGLPGRRYRGGGDVAALAPTSPSDFRRWASWWPMTRSGATPRASCAGRALPICPSGGVPRHNALANGMYWVSASRWRRSALIADNSRSSSAATRNDCAAPCATRSGSQWISSLALLLLLQRLDACRIEHSARSHARQKLVAASL